MNKIFINYINTFKGLSREVYSLSLITFINRSVTMVIPFLSLYLNKSLDISIPNIGWITSFFELGSIVGTWIGGKLTDKIGYYKVMFVSLVLTGIFFVLLQYIATFEGFCISVF